MYLLEIQRHSTLQRATLINLSHSYCTEGDEAGLASLS
jgi:hypothetical protein